MSEKAKKQSKFPQYFDLSHSYKSLAVTTKLHFSVFGLFDYVWRMQNLAKIDIVTSIARCMHACWVSAASSVHYSICSCKVHLPNHLACIVC